MNPSLVIAARELDDERRLPTEGYVAEFHRSLSETICVWAPCGCVVVLNNATSILTPCADKDCKFSWIDANEALRLLLEHKEKPCEGSVSIVPNPLALAVTTATASTSESPAANPEPSTAETV